MKKILLILIICASFIAVPVYAQDRSGGNPGVTSGGDIANLDNNIRLEEIKIPIFSSFIDFNTQNASILSWVAFIGSLATVGLVIFWIFLLVKAGVAGLRSQGNPEAVGAAFKQVQSILIGAAISMFFPFVLSIIGVFFGIGSIFSWPKMFQLCSEGNTYQFYYQALLDSKQNPLGSAAYATELCNSGEQ